MRSLREMSANDLRDLRRAASEAIEAIAWLDLQVVDVSGLKQGDAQFSAAADALRKIDAETQRRKRAAVS